MTNQQKKNTGHSNTCPCYIRNPRIVQRSIDDTVFLVNTETDAIFHLNQVGTTIWQLLTEPIEISKAVAIVQQAFPDVQPNNIAEDVSKLINEMIEGNLVICHG